MFFNEYRKSLKSGDAEELLDLLIYRPPAYILVKGIYRTRVSPNQVTALSLVAGLAAAFFFSQASSSSFTWGALLLVMANVLDCADGQLARLQKSGTLLGRVWDGVADYISMIAIFLGVGIGLSNNVWWLVIIAGLSSAIHAMVFDCYQSEFIGTADRGDLLSGELQRFTEEIRRRREERRDPLKIFLVEMYVWYLKIQQRLRGWQRGGNQKRMIRLWSFLGPTTNRTVLVVCALLSRPDLYLWIIAVGGNAWLAACVFMDRR